MAFLSALTTSRGKTLTLKWPPYSLSNGRYYIALYFQDNRFPSPFSWRVFDIHVNGQIFYQDLNVTDDGENVFGTEWPLNGQTEISLVPKNGIPVGPLINAGEVLQIFPVGGRTVTRDGNLLYSLSIQTTGMQFKIEGWKYFTLDVLIKCSLRLHLDSKIQKVGNLKSSVGIY